MKSRLNQARLEPRHGKGLHELPDKHIIEAIRYAPEKEQQGHKRKKHAITAGQERGLVCD